MTDKLKHHILYIDDLAEHLKARFENTQLEGWREVQPLPDGKTLGISLLELVEKHCHCASSGYTTASVSLL